jgi:hypothetical protein
LSISYGIKIQRIAHLDIKEYGIWKTKFQSDVDDKCKPYVKLTQMGEYLYRSIYIYIYIYIQFYLCRNADTQFRISRQYLLLAKLEEYSLFNAEYITILS